MRSPGPWQPRQFAILNHAIADSGIARQQESTPPRFGIKKLAADLSLGKAMLQERKL
jgi:hypothetical protein